MFALRIRQGEPAEEGHLDSKITAALPGVQRVPADDQLALANAAAELPSGTDDAVLSRTVRNRLTRSEWA